MKLVHLTASYLVTGEKESKRVRERVRKQEVCYIAIVVLIKMAGTSWPPVRSEWTVTGT